MRSGQAKLAATDPAKWNRVGYEGQKSGQYEGQNPGQQEPIDPLLFFEHRGRLNPWAYASVAPGRPATEGEIAVMGSRFLL
jgi:hypothetical protein